MPWAGVVAGIVGTADTNARRHWLRPCFDGLSGGVRRFRVCSQSSLSPLGEGPTVGFVLGVVLLFSATCWAQEGSFPPADQNLVLEAPISSWDEAIPLGNGLMGGLLWGEKVKLRLSLDRGDLWDERPAVGKNWWKDRNYARGQRLVEEKKFDELSRLWDGPYKGPHPTKLPGGRVEITLAPGQSIKNFELNLATAEGFVRLTDGEKIRAIVSAAEPVVLLRIPGPEPKAIDLVPPSAVKILGYPPAKRSSTGRAQWYVQDAAEGFSYCVCVESVRDRDETLLAVAVTSSGDGPDPAALARGRCTAALAHGYAALRKPHVAWWTAFWAQSSLSLPDPLIQRYYVLCRYYYGAASRRGAPPMPLQGVWTADSGSLPPWKGDYHNDLNTQMTYIAYHQAGHFEEGASYLDFLWQRRAVFEQFARNFYGTPGLACPGVMSLAGQPLGGWGQYSMSPTMSAWSAHLFYLHWRYTTDEAFLRTEAYPWCKGVAECMRAMLKPDASGVLKLPLSSSPEIFDNSGRAWLVPNSNYDLFCLKMLFLAVQEMAEACGDSAEAIRWAEAAVALGPAHVDPQGVLLLDAKTSLTTSHRHLSNLIGIYPFNLVTCEGSENDRKQIAASLAQWDKLGTKAWCGYSFSWMSCLEARVGRTEPALVNLERFVRAFLLRNGFHANGDQSRTGLSNFTYRPFTLEGNFLAMQAVHEMLLQSWSPTPGRRDTQLLRIFPATPWRWRDVAFRDLRTEGGFRVSGKRERGAIRWFRIVASRDGTLRLADSFGPQVPQWSRPDVNRRDNHYELLLHRGESLEATLPAPTLPSDPPKDAAEPVTLPPRFGK